MHTVTRALIGLRLLAFLLTWSVVLPSGGAAQAGTSSKACTLDGQNVMAFGSYDPMSNSPLDMQGQVSYRCYNVNNPNANAAAQSSGSGDNGPLTVQISFSAGNAGGFNRYMAGPGDQLRYNLYIDAQRQAVWGDGTGGTRVYTERAQPNNHLTTVPVFGRIFGAQDVGAGTYLDSLIVTLDF